MMYAFDIDAYGAMYDMELVPQDDGKPFNMSVVYHTGQIALGAVARFPALYTDQLYTDALRALIEHVGNLTKKAFAVNKLAGRGVVLDGWERSMRIDALDAWDGARVLLARATSRPDGTRVANYHVDKWSTTCDLTLPRHKALRKTMLLLHYSESAFHALVHDAGYDPSEDRVNALAAYLFSTDAKAEVDMDRLRLKVNKVYTQLNLEITTA